MKKYIPKVVLVLSTIIVPWCHAAFNDVPDQYLEVNISYDRSTGQFYDLEASGSELVELSIIDSGDFPAVKLKHGRDGYLGVSVPYNTTIRYNSSYGGEPEHGTLFGRKSGQSISLDIGKGDTMLWMPPFLRRWHVSDSGGCNVDATTHTTQVPSEMVSTDVNGVFDLHWCLSEYYNLSNATFPTDINQVGFIDRYFRVSRSALNNAPYDTYSHSFSIITTESMRIGDTQRGREAYHYTINVHIKPSIQQFDIDRSVLDLKVKRVNGRIIGEGHTGFTASGSFDKYQPFTATITSMNACGSSLCLMNGSLSIPYEVDVFDPVTLLKKKISTSGGNVVINADREYEMNGTLSFMFDVPDEGQHGVFFDVAIVRLALVL